MATSSNPSLIERVFERADQMGLSTDLPRLSGLSAQRIAEIKGAAPLSAAEYEQICRGLAVDPVSMYRGHEGDPRRTPSRFRAAVSADRPNPADVRLLALAAEQGRILAYLLSLCGREIGLAKYRRTIQVKSGIDFWRQGYELGERARTALHPTAGPIASVENLLRSHEIHVARVAFSSDDVDAAAVWEAGAVPIVLVNGNSGSVDHTGALRATLAHELGHLLHDAGEGDVTTRVSWGVEAHGSYKEAVEVRARGFAPGFLAPRSHTQAWCASAYPDGIADSALVTAIAEHWGLSFAGAAWHAKNCGLISNERATELAHLPRKPYVNLPGFEVATAPLAPTSPSLPTSTTGLWTGLAVEIVRAALDGGHITIGRARELLTWE